LGGFKTFYSSLGWMPMAGLRQLLALGVVTLFAAGAATTGLGQETAPNACKLAGVTQTVAASVFGKGARTADSPTQGGTPPNLGAICTVEEGAGAPRYIGAIYVEPYALAEFPALEAGYGALRTQTRLQGLGAKAVFAHSSDPSSDVVEFARGRYAILLASGQAGGSPANDYPTEADYLTVAHAVYKHLG
jgi:hypothetical protein